MRFFFSTPFEIFLTLFQDSLHKTYFYVLFEKKALLTIHSNLLQFMIKKMIYLINFLSFVHNNQPRINKHVCVNNLNWYLSLVLFLSHTLRRWIEIANWIANCWTQGDDVCYFYVFRLYTVRELSDINRE